MRIGHGYDVHRFQKGRKCILCGVEIPCEFGPDGHSDADVPVHALMDALLGAAALGDIGHHFPDNDKQYENISSILLLGKVMQKLIDKGYKVGNADITIIVQRPKVAKYIREMQRKIADSLFVDIDCVNIKATTEEGLGFTGDGSGIAAHAVVLLL